MGEHSLDTSQELTCTSHTLDAGDGKGWVFPIPDQKTNRIVRILVEEIIPFCGVLKPCCQTLLSVLMRDV